MAGRGGDRPGQYTENLCTQPAVRNDDGDRLLRESGFPRHRWRNTWSVITSLHPKPGEHSSIYGDEFRKQVEVLGIKEVLSVPRSPWQRAYIERIIGSIRRNAWIMSSSSMKHRYVAHYVCISATTMNRGFTFRWIGTHPTHARYSRSAK